MNWPAGLPRLAGLSAPLAHFALVGLKDELSVRLEGNHSALRASVSSHNKWSLGYILACDFVW